MKLQIFFFLLVSFALSLKLNFCLLLKFAGEKKFSIVEPWNMFELEHYYLELDSVCLINIC